MNRNHGLKCAFEGELAEALAWEAKRREVPAQQLVQQLLLTIAAETIEAWRAAKRVPAQAQGQRTPQGPSVESVLKLSYGPQNDHAPGRRRRTTTDSSS